MEYRDKKGCSYEVKKGLETDIPRLLEMYDHFSPKGRFQGLPPINQEMCRKWITHLFQNGENFLADRDGQIIGHALLMPDDTLLDSEYLVFVSQFHRNRGVGTGLTNEALKRVKALGLKLIWLTVDASNFIAIRLYKNFGFQFCDQACLNAERKMVLEMGDRFTECK